MTVQHSTNIEPWSSQYTKAKYQGLIGNRKRHQRRASRKEEGMTREEIIRILLVDDVELVRHTLRTILSRIHGSQSWAKPATERRLSRGSNDAIPQWW